MVTKNKTETEKEESGPLPGLTTKTGRLRPATAGQAPTDKAHNTSATACAQRSQSKTKTTADTATKGSRSNNVTAIITTKINKYEQTIIQNTVTHGVFGTVGYWGVGCRLYPYAE